MLTNKEILLDKMRGGWYGKNIGGTLGGPLEVRMELMDIRFYTQTFDGPMPNDDLDLQLVNLHCLEQYGARITAGHLGKEWVSHVFFPFDEYGHALTNLRRGIAPPVAGAYNNLFTDCMGAPIRSEIWAMAAAGYPELAAYYALQDASVDHAGGEGVYGEIFFAVLECLAFSESDRTKLIESALSYLPPDSITARAVRDLLRHHAEGLDWKEARSRILDAYGTPNFTYAPPNIAFTILGLLYGKDFSEAICLTCSCGYDTDCTAATLGAILGILGGMAAIPQRWIDPIGSEIKVSAAVNGFPAPADLEELTERTYKVHQLVHSEWENASDKSVFALDYDCQRLRWLLPEGSFSHPDLTVTARFSDGHPAIGENGKLIAVTLRNHLSVGYTGHIRLEPPAGLLSGNGFPVSLKPGEEKCFHFAVSRVRPDGYWYECKIRIERRVKDLLWTAYSLPLVLTPMTQWVISSPRASVEIECPTSLIEFDRLPGDAAHGDLTAKTSLTVPDDRRIDFIVATTSPVRLRVDGETLFESDAPTPFIPAYHRSASEKRACASMTKGTHLIEITVRATDGHFPRAAFYMVQPDSDRWFPHYVDAVLTV